MKDIGSTLKKAREEKGLALEEVANTLQVALFKVESLEDNQYDHLSLSEVPRILKDYAKLLGLDEEDILLAYVKKISEQPSEKGLKQLKLKLPSFQKNQIVFYLLVLLVIGIVSMVVFLTIRDRLKGPLITPPTEVSLPTSTTTTTTKASTEALKSKPKSASVKKEKSKTTLALDEKLLKAKQVVPVKVSTQEEIKIEVKVLKGICWIGISSEQSTVASDTLPQGKSVQVTLKKDTKTGRIALGAASCVKVIINGQDFPSLEKVGTNPITFDLTFTK